MRKINNNSLSGFRGISWVERIAKWQASIKYKSEMHHLGYFLSIADAQIAIMDWERDPLGYEKAKPRGLSEIPQDEVNREIINFPKGRLSRILRGKYWRVDIEMSDGSYKALASSSIRDRALRLYKKYVKD